ncbi:MAG: class I SAM-dependent methyltransferase, partial [Methanobacterium sp.]
MIGLKIKKNRANDVRILLLKQSLIDLDFKIKRENDFVIIPLINEPEKEILMKIGED